MCCEHASTAAFATKRHEANFAGDYRSALSGATPMARSASIQTKPWSPLSTMSLRALPRQAQHAVSGYGFARKGSHSLCRCIRRRDPLGRGQLQPLFHHVLTNPVYAGAYAYGKSRHETMLDASGARRKRVRLLPRSEWQVLIPDHHPGFIDWQTYEANQDRMAKNTRPRTTQGGWRREEGNALLQSLATCGHCGRRLHTHYRGRNSAPGYHCQARSWSRAAASIALNIGGIQIDEAVARASLRPLNAQSSALLLPLLNGLKLIARPRSSNGVSVCVKCRGASYEASRAERRYRARSR